MANTEAENQATKFAYSLIRMKYGKWLPAGKRWDGLHEALQYSKNIDLYVKFMDSGPFNTNMSMTSPIKGNSPCVTTGFTTLRLGSTEIQEIYINRALSNRTTIVHELLHFFTHPDFDKRIAKPLNEAITERFTRKVLGHADAKLPTSKKVANPGFEVAGRAGRYDELHTFLNMGREGLNQTAGHMKDYTKLAYFQGNSAAIEFVAKNLDLGDAFD